MSAPFASIPPTATNHYRLMLFGAALRLAEWAGSAGAPAQDYLSEASELWGGECPDATRWFEAVDGWAEAKPALPFSRLARAGFASLHRRLVALVALLEEDARLAALIEPGGGRPSIGGVLSLWCGMAPGLDVLAVRSALLDCVAAGLLQIDNGGAMRNEQRLRLSAPLADILCGESPRMAGVRLIAPELHPPAGHWIAPGAGAPHPEGLAALLRGEPAPVVLLRGAGANGRRTLLHMAAGLGWRGVLEVERSVLDDPALYLQAGALALAGDAILLADVAPAPGETVRLPAHAAYAGPVVLLCGKSGAIEPPPGRPLVALTLPMPPPEARARHWARVGLGDLADDLADIRLTSGGIGAVASAAKARAQADGRDAPALADVRAAIADVADPRLDMVASPIPQTQALDPLQLDAREQADFEALLLRCRHREALAGDGGAGVRALFAGPSGTGKTLGARHIAAALGKPLFRVDLAATVNKYIGETEKNLERALCAAEERDMVLLLDEGDSLMARRTDVGSSNDRYANLETNYLLQRIERFDGILLVTSNDAERIDPAFARRMDAMLTFRPPDEIQREAILSQLLARHEVSEALLQEVACRCALSGGQLRNIAVHARLLAIDARRPIGDEALRAAVAHEYRKTGGFCPLRAPLAAVS